MALLLTVRVASAQGSSDAARSSEVLAPRVDIVVNGSAEDGQALAESLREMLQRLGLELSLTVVDQFRPAEPWPAVPPEVLVRVWIDARKPDGTLITLSDRRSGRTGAARLVPRRGSHGLLLEETALVVHSDTESLLSEPVPSPVPVSPTPPMPAVPPVPPPARTGPRRAPRPVHAAVPWTLDALTFAEGQSFAKDTSVVFGTGAGGRVHVGDSAWYPGLWLIAAYHFPFGQTALPVQLNANVWSVRLVPTVRSASGHALLVEAGIGAGTDVFVIRPGATQGVSHLDAKRTDVSPIVASLLALHVVASPTARFTLAATLDWDLSPRRYLAASGATRDVLIQPFPFRPGLTLGMCFELARAGAAR